MLCVSVHVQVQRAALHHRHLSGSLHVREVLLPKPDGAGQQSSRRGLAVGEFAMNTHTHKERTNEQKIEADPQQMSVYHKNEHTIILKMNSNIMGLYLDSRGLKQPETAF